MRMPDHPGAPDDRTSRGAESFSSEESTRADLEKPVAESAIAPTETPPDTGLGGAQISGPGPNALTRGLP